MADTINTKVAAEMLGTDPKTLRVFLRATLKETPGKGGRYELTKGQVSRQLKPAFTKWMKQREADKAARAAARAEEAKKAAEAESDNSDTEQKLAS